MFVRLLKACILFHGVVPSECEGDESEELTPVSCKSSEGCHVMKGGLLLQERSQLQAGRHQGMRVGGVPWDSKLVKAGAVPVSPSDVEMVVASHCEDMAWFDSFQGRVSVYNKGLGCDAALQQSLSSRAANFPEAGLGRLVDLSNQGREGDTYLRHIIDNYDNLSHYTVFAQGAGEHNGVKVMDKVAEFMQLGNKTVPIVPIVHRNAKGLILFRDRDPDEPVKNGDVDENNVFIFDLEGVPTADKARSLYMALFGGTACEAPPMVYAAGAQFIVSREAILSRPKSFYEHLDTAVDGDCGELGYVLERVWLFIFDPNIKPLAEPKKLPDYCQWMRTGLRLSQTLDKHTFARGDCKEYKKQTGVQHFTDML